MGSGGDRTFHGNIEQAEDDEAGNQREGQPSCWVSLSPPCLDHGQTLRRFVSCRVYPFHVQLVVSATSAVLRLALPAVFPRCLTAPRSTLPGLAGRQRLVTARRSEGS
jgi:hypothetical protein